MSINPLSGFSIFLTIIFIIISVLMILIILVQRGRGGGLAGAFGAGGGGTTAFGTKTGDVFTWVTVIFFGLFIILAVYLNSAYKPEELPPTPTPAAVLPGAGSMPAFPTTIVPPSATTGTATGTAASLSATATAPTPATTSTGPGATMKVEATPATAPK